MSGLCSLMLHITGTAGNSLFQFLQLEVTSSSLLAPLVKHMENLILHQKLIPFFQHPPYISSNAYK